MNKKIKIANKFIGMGGSTFIIAEVGSNHDRKLTQAKELINAASESDVDAIKFQIFKAEGLYPKNSPMFNIMKKNELPRKWIGELCEYAKKKGLIFLASPFDKEAIDLLCEINSPAFKWASSETVNLPLLRYAAAKKKPMFISTGMCNLADVYEAVEVVRSAGNQHIILLHCTSLYPTKPRYVNLRAMDTLRDAFHLPVGYSDHTFGFIVSVAAVARGACVIEKHFTLDRRLKGPDHSYALEPDELKQMVIMIRAIEQSLGSPTVKMHLKVKENARKNSIIAKKKIPKGAVITEDAILISWPALGIEPRFIKIVVGQKTKRDIKQGEPIVWDMVA